MKTKLLKKLRKRYALYRVNSQQMGPIIYVTDRIELTTDVCYSVEHFLKMALLRGGYFCLLRKYNNKLKNRG